jgi:hypothetical protein
VEFARALSRVGSSRAHPQLGHRWFRGRPPLWVAYAGAGIASAVIALIVSAYLANDRLAPTDVRSSAPTAENSPASAANPIPTFVLMAGLVRGRNGQGTTVSIPPGAEAVLLEVHVEGVEPDRSYRASLRTPEGGEVWAGPAVGQSRPGGEGPYLAVRVPSRVLAPGDYLLSLRSAAPFPESLASGAFRVANR